MLRSDIVVYIYSPEFTTGSYGKEKGLKQNSYTSNATDLFSLYFI